MIKIYESFNDEPITLQVKGTGEKIYYVPSYAIEYTYILAQYSEEDQMWYYQNTSNDHSQLEEIAQNIPWDSVDPWIVKVADCEVV